MDVFWLGDVVIKEGDVVPGGQELVPDGVIDCCILHGEVQAGN